ncbi:MAG: hypothetical protein JWM93_3981 [Frankiales bacterium]|nr:hypothetical protein [Frankiales bacterium]
MGKARRRRDQQRVDRRETHRDIIDDPRFVAAVDLIGRTGAVDFQIRYCDEDPPVVWIAVASYRNGEQQVQEAAAAMRPVEAVFRLCAQLIDGGTCAHCGRGTGFHEDVDTLPAHELVCWYQWDPELATFRRGCEGDQ